MQYKVSAHEHREANFQNKPSNRWPDVWATSELVFQFPQQCSQQDNKWKNRNILFFQFLRECWGLWVGSIRRQSRSSGCLWRLPPSCLWPSLRCVCSSTTLLWSAKCPESALAAIGPCCVLRPHIGCRCSAVRGKQERLGRSGMGALVPIPLTGYWLKHLQQSRRSPLTTATADKEGLCL